MSDPAAEAAQRALESHTGGVLQMADIAREALAPFRDRHRPFTRDYPGGDGRTVCAYCLGPKDWPCPDAVDAYTSAELER